MEEEGCSSILQYFFFAHIGYVVEDVYKRQDIDFKKNTININHTMNYTVTLDGTCKYTAVSYTHLDVYKRQAR